MFSYLARVDIVLELRAHPAALAIGIARPRAEAGRPEGKVVLVREEPRRLRERERDENLVVRFFWVAFYGFTCVSSLSWQMISFFSYEDSA